MPYTFGCVSVDPIWGHGSTSKNWSYWVVLQSGHNAARDNILRVGERLDIDQLNDGYELPIDQNFAKHVRSFEIDFFEINFLRTGVVLGNKYFGMNADLNGLGTHPLHKYSDLATIEDFYVTPKWPNQMGELNQVFSIIFARND